MNFFSKNLKIFFDFFLSKGSPLWIFKKSKKNFKFFEKNFINKKCAYGPKMKPRQGFRQISWSIWSGVPNNPRGGGKKGSFFRIFRATEQCHFWHRLKNGTSNNFGSRQNFSNFFFPWIRPIRQAYSLLLLRPRYCSQLLRFCMICLASINTLGYEMSHFGCFSIITTYALVVK